jgi:rhamnosyltransferase
MEAGRRSILTAVVTWRPDAGLASRLAALGPQADHLLVIDNGSPDISRIRAAAAAAGGHVLANAANLGMAAALNQAAVAARKAGCAWLAAFDQDSLVPAGALADLLDLWEAHADRDRIGVLSMSRRDVASGRDYHRPGDILAETADWRSVRTAITSGSLIRADLIESLGGFDERLFIDGVDHEFCLRARAAGWLVVESRRTIMDHALGAIEARRLLGQAGPVSNHAPDRRFYITRNTLEICLRRPRLDPIWRRHALAHLAKESLAVALLERQRAAKIAAMAQGVWRFAAGRFGPRRNPEQLGLPGPRSAINQGRHAQRRRNPALPAH